MAVGESDGLIDFEYGFDTDIRVGAMFLFCDIGDDDRLFNDDGDDFEAVLFLASW